MQSLDITDFIFSPESIKLSLYVREEKDISI